MKIKCPACDFENEESAKYCINCGKPFSEQKNSEVISRQRELKIKEEEKIREKVRVDLKEEAEPKIGCIAEFFIFLIALIFVLFLFLTIKSR